MDIYSYIKVQIFAQVYIAILSRHFNEFSSVLLSKIPVLGVTLRLVKVRLIFFHVKSNRLHLRLYSYIIEKGKRKVQLVPQ